MTSITKEDILQILTATDSEIIRFMLETAKYRENNLITFSKNVFIPLTEICRNDCGYCNFKKNPDDPQAIILKTKEEILGDLKYIHAAASNALLNYEDARFNLVRPGIILYGYPGEEKTFEKISLKPIAKLKAKVIFLKEVPEGTSIGYSRSYITTKQTKVANVPIGYADGFRRDFSNGWEVLIKGKKVPIIGKVCMDSFMVDVTDLEDVNIGDEVIIWDNENIKGL